MGQRLLTADAAELDAEKRSVRLKGNVEFLDPTLHVRGQGGDFADDAGSFQGAEFEITDRGVRGSARRTCACATSPSIDLEGVRYTACPPGNEDWELRAGSISIDQETRIGTGPRRAPRVHGHADPLRALDHRSRSATSASPACCSRRSATAARPARMIAVPWYWNIAPNYDATFTARYFSSRGLRLDPEFRYLTERSQGNAQRRVRVRRPRLTAARAASST